MRTYYKYEYRINKKGAECYRTRNLEEAKLRLAELNTRRPIYTMQSRCCACNRVGVAEITINGKELWGPWGNW